MTASARCAPTTLHLPFTASSVSVARQRLKGWMAGLDGSSENGEDARLVISELVANAIRHAQPLSDGSIVVSWSREREGVRLSVTDGGSSTRPRTVQAAPTASAGRGMSIVEVLTQNWWTERTDTRTTVHALLGV